MEVDYLMGLDESGVQLHDGDNAVINNVTEWLDTQRGTVYGMPWWGHELAKFKHEPPSDATAVAIENSVLTGLMRDVANISIRGIRCDMVSGEIDTYRVKIATAQGYVETTKTL